jgi:peptide/nickel transport system substrate-binding protein
MKKYILFTFVIVLVLLCAMVLAACSTTSKTTQTTQTTQPAKTTTTSSPAGTVTKQTGGKLVLLQTTELNSFYNAEQSGPEDGMQSRPAMETLIVYAKDGTFKPWLLEAVTEDAQAKTITVKVRKNIKFHDGTPLNAAAVKWNLEQIAKSQRFAPDYKAITSMDIVDDYTLRINFSQWNSYFLNTWIGQNIMSPTSFEKNGLEWCRTHCVGTGPFKLVSYERDVKKVFERNDDYWRGKPYLDSMEIKIVPDQTVQVSMLLSGQADIISGVTYSDAQEFKNNNKFIVSQSIVNQGVTFLAPNSINPNSPFAKLEVRQAISYAIDKDKILPAIYKGFGAAANQLGHQGIWCYNPSVAGYPYDPAKAKALLEKAGLGSGFTTKLYSRNEADTVALDTAVADYLSKIGVKVEINAVNQGQYMTLMIMQGWSEGILMGSVQAYPDAQLLMKDLSSLGHVGFSKSLAHFDDLDKKVSDAIQAPDFNTKKDTVLQLQTMFIDKYALVTPIVTAGSKYLKSAKLHDDYVCVIYEQPDTFGDAWKEK